MFKPRCSEKNFGISWPLLQADEERPCSVCCMRESRANSENRATGRRISLGLTVSLKTAKHLAFRRKNERVLTVSRKKNVNRKKI